MSRSPSNLIGFLVALSAAPGVALGLTVFPQRSLEVGLRVQDIEVGDFNKDGIPDLAFADDGEVVCHQPEDCQIAARGHGLLLGLGAREFLPFLPTGPEITPIPGGEVRFADFNLDGIPDFVGSLYGNGISVVLIDRFLVSTVSAVLLPQRTLHSVATGDFNGDGNPDLAATDWFPDRVLVFLGDGKGGFGEATPLEAGQQPLRMAVRDLNGDGNEDLVVGNTGSADITVILSRGNEGFAPQVRLPLGSAPLAVITRDLDGDGREDLSVGASGEILVFRGLGDGTFGPPVRHLVPGGGFPLAAADLNRDGRLDLFVGLSDEIGVLINRGDGVFELALRLPSGRGILDIAAGDLDSDGNLDLAVIDGEHVARLIFGLSGGGFAVESRLPLADRAASAVSADFDADGRDDLVTAHSDSNQISVWTEVSDVGLEPRTVLDVASGPRSLAIGDFNLDSNVDLISGNSGSRDFAVFLGRGDGTFLDAIRTPAAGAPISIAVGDLNGDGRPDLVVASESSTAFRTYLGNGTGTFSPGPLGSLSSNVLRVSLDDLDSDGLLDLIALADERFGEFCGCCDDGCVDTMLPGFAAVLPGLGGGAFATAYPVLAVGAPGAAATGDFDSDGRREAVIAMGRYTQPCVRPLCPNAESTLTHGEEAPASPRSLVVGDFNGDGRQDFAVAVRRDAHLQTAPDRYALAVYLSRGDGTSLRPIRIGTCRGETVAGDFNGDSKTDLAVIDESSRRLCILESQSISSNFPPVAEAGPEFLLSPCTSPEGGVVRMDGSSSRDIDSAPGTNDDIVRFDWFEDFGTPAQRRLGEGPVLNLTMPFGAHRIRLRVTDSEGELDTDLLTVSVTDTTPPTLTCPPSASRSCSRLEGSQVNLLAAASDTCSADVPIVNDRTGGGADASGLYPVGESVVTFTARDAAGNRTQCRTTVTVTPDESAPELSATLYPSVLWPPNHRLVPVHASVSANDACDPALSVLLLSVESSEADDAPGNGDGATQGDVQEAASGSADFDFVLRAERAGDEGGRRYSVTYAAMDASGNLATVVSDVTVPRDRLGLTDPLSVSARESDRGTLVEWTRVAEARQYSVIRGEVDQITETAEAIVLGAVRCVEAASEDTSTLTNEDPDIPAPGKTFFYLVAYDDGLRSSYGTESVPKPRTVRSGACQ